MISNIVIHYARDIWRKLILHTNFVTNILCTFIIWFTILTTFDVEIAQSKYSFSWHGIKYCIFRHFKAVRYIRLTIMMQLSQLRFLFLTQISLRYYGIAVHDFIACFFCITINHNLYWITPNVKHDMCLERVFECHFYRIVYICYFIETHLSLLQKLLFIFVPVRHWYTVKYFYFLCSTDTNRSYACAHRKIVLSFKETFVYFTRFTVIKSDQLIYEFNIEYSYKGSENATK